MKRRGQTSPTPRRCGSFIVQDITCTKTLCFLRPSKKLRTLLLGSHCCMLIASMQRRDSSAVSFFFNIVGEFIEKVSMSYHHDYNNSNSLLALNRMALDAKAYLRG